jgi:hypothetical protein
LDFAAADPTLILAAAAVKFVGGKLKENIL